MTWGKKILVVHPQVKPWSQGFGGFKLQRYGVPLVPFLLQDVAGVDSLNQPDGIHPTPAGQRRIAETMWRYLEPVLRGIPAA